MHKRYVMISASLTLLLLAGGLTSTTAQAAEDEPDKEWREVEAQLPAAPKNENLLPFYQSGSMQFFIDAPSLSIASDGTVRYTLVASSSAGARNVSYEGIRCATYEKKLYAFGRSDGTWSRSRRDEWDKISQTGANKQHHSLFTEYFCEGNTIAGKANSILDRLRGKRTLYGR
ncbi:CNP1-like family protein [Undibacterium rugosum]|uniref:CNP1-like family protein n=2 Tax=Undibacterium rugosum TaxID=2762291 RepID=A0A923I189_9BURK|nr:CNP1-like family protein [Undibacterium rugosum]MBC3935192.1 CNP1-like family protein [Undibacterium rugosum]